MVDFYLIKYYERSITLSLLPVCKFTYLHISVSTSKTCTTLHFNLWDKNSPINKLIKSKFPSSVFYSPQRLPGI